MSLIGSLSTDVFLRDYWQQRPLVVRGVRKEASYLMDGNDLAGLACEADAAARLVCFDPAKDDWSCEYGPFDAPKFASLPTTNWTLLVQGVDQWLPEVAALIDLADFLPAWRVDDVMVSYAVRGGGVGPHFDHYDVFLLQGSGRRLWETGHFCGPETPLRPHPDLRLLNDMEVSEQFETQSGDVLYVPAGLAHRGVALDDDCMTYSIGFRAPSHADILRQAVEEICAELTESDRYVDPREGFGPDRNALGPHVEQIIESIAARLTPESFRAAALRGFGRLVTETADTALASAPDNDLAELPVSLAATSRHDAPAGRSWRREGSRFAYRKTSGDAELFVDGEAMQVSLAFAQAVCACHGDTLELTSDLDAQAYAALLRRGSLTTEEDHGPLASRSGDESL